MSAAISGAPIPANRRRSQATRYGFLGVITGGLLAAAGGTIAAFDDVAFVLGVLLTEGGGVFVTGGLLAEGGGVLMPAFDDAALENASLRFWPAPRFLTVSGTTFPLFSGKGFGGFIVLL
jgi:hypothetical protein